MRKRLSDVELSKSDNMTQYDPLLPQTSDAFFFVHHIHSPLPTTTTLRPSTPLPQLQHRNPISYSSSSSPWTTSSSSSTTSPTTVPISTTSPRLCRPIFPHRRDLLHHLGQPRHPPVPAPNTTFSTTFLIPTPPTSAVHPTSFYHQLPTHFDNYQLQYQ